MVKLGKTYINFVKKKFCSQDEVIKACLKKLNVVLKLLWLNQNAKKLKLFSHLLIKML